MKITLNPDKEVVQAVKEGLKRTGGYCPCRLERTEDNKCMCREFREQMQRIAPEIPAETVSLKDVYIDVDNANYEIAHTPLLENAKVAVSVNGKTTSDYVLREVGEYKVKTVYETTTFSEIISKVGDVTYEQDVMIYRTGDANNDGESTLSDLMRLKKQQTGVGKGITKADAKGVDLDDDDKVTGTDAALMRDLLGEETTVEELKKAVEGVNVGVISDLHYSVNASDGQRRLNTRKALNYYKSQNADMIILNGDVADLGMTAEYQKLVEDITAVFPDKETRPKLIFTADNHEYYEAWSHNKVPTDTFEGLQTRFLTQLESVNDNSDGMNSHYVINGYHFISISSDGMDTNNRATYSDATKAFLEQAMAEAKAEDATKPIFVNVHQPPENTVIGSDLPGGGSPGRGRTHLGAGLPDRERENPPGGLDSDAGGERRAGGRRILSGGTHKKRSWRDLYGKTGSAAQRGRLRPLPLGKRGGHRPVPKRISALGDRHDTLSGRGGGGAFCGGTPGIRNRRPPHDDE